MVVLTIRMALELSVLLIRRVSTSRMAPKKAEPSGNRNAMRKASPVGCMITKTPVKPTRIAAHRRQPTLSPRNGIASATATIGPAKVIAIASAIGN